MVEWTDNSYELTGNGETFLLVFQTCLVHRMCDVWLLLGGFGGI